MLHTDGHCRDTCNGRHNGMLNLTLAWVKGFGLLKQIKKQAFRIVPFLKRKKLKYACKYVYFLDA